eukprot:scaffold298040_cov30-Tisochrysis_lutea.AAC.5
MVNGGGVRLGAWSASRAEARVHLDWCGLSLRALLLHGVGHDCRPAGAANEEGSVARHDPIVLTF